MRAVFKIVPYSSKTSYEKYFFVVVNDSTDVSSIVSSLISCEDKSCSEFEFLNNNLLELICKDKDYRAHGFHVLKQPAGFYPSIENTLFTEV